MAQISNANLQSVMDKVARHVAEFDGATLASAVATGAAYATTSPNAGLTKANSDVIASLATLIAGLNDINQEGDLGPPAQALSNFNPVGISFYASLWSGLRRALDIHGLRFNAPASGDLSGLDSMLRVLNASAPTLRAHGLLQTYLGGLSPNNIFTPTPFTLATIAVTGATTATFTNVAAMTTYAQGQLAILNTKTEGLTSTVLTLQGTKGGTANTQFTATVGNTTNNWLTVCSDVTLLWTACTSFVSISGGVSGDTFSIVVIPDRQISTS